MRLAFGISLTRSRYPGGLDPDAAAYIAAVETALSSSISGDQKNAINAVANRIHTNFNMQPRW